MAEAIQLQASRTHDGNLTYLTPIHSEYGVVIVITPNTVRKHNTAIPTLCDRVKISVGKQTPTPDIPTNRDALTTSFEMPVTKPPRIQEHFDAIAHNAAVIAVSAASAMFALYEQGGV